MSATGSLPVCLANKASTAELGVSIANPPDAYQCSFALPSELSIDARAQIWNMFEKNMHDLYIDSSFGWNPSEKQLELFNVLSRFILLQAQNDSNQIAGFCMFRFEHEDGNDLLYCYEIQIADSHQRKGLGKYLINLLSSVGVQWKMHKVMLTVFSANLGAIEFYRQIGFDVDASSPGYEDDDDNDEDDDIDYQILSKPC